MSTSIKTVTPLENPISAGVIFLTAYRHEKKALKIIIAVSTYLKDLGKPQAGLINRKMTSKDKKSVIRMSKTIFFPNLFLEKMQFQTVQK